MQESEREHSGFLIGALVNIPTAILMRRVQEGLIAAGFHELRPAHTPVFQLLAPQGSRVTDLAEQAGIAKQSMGYLIDYLEKHGYVERIPDPTDGRAQLVRRTPRGWEVNQVSAQLVWEIQQEWTQLLGEERMKHLMSLLSELVSLLGEQYNESVAEWSRLRKT
ncbi:MarR family transcriptional regulator [Ktedonosporobacter rubrisoli]|uniref:MarR family transcriptional regulator n=1 Tax=Ktedonosporobacter rubrisoli TaxID=2509675 RepID=A0A4P6K3R4_KTERU|nr:MarR family transcriptional regulator [Ktedonosporobacter rubrisoli]QBD82839.1 MarR family transcriptional regulator [Ktedonosporobacter rubrisoli]